MATPPPPAPPPLPQPEAHVAPNAQYNALRPSLTFNGALLWPAFLTPTADTPADKKGKTGRLLNHWHYKPGKLSHLPAAPAWQVQETFAAAEYEYDKQYAGVPLAGVDVDLFMGSAAEDLGDYDQFSRFYGELFAERARLLKDPNAEPRTFQNQKLLDAMIASAVTDSAGRFTFRGLRAGEYLIFVRGRLSFVEIDAAGGEVAPTPPVQHNGVKTAPLSGAHGAHRLWVKLKIGASGSIELLAKKGGADAPFNTDRLLDPGQKIADMTQDTPYRFYALPLAVKSNTRQWNACAAELGHTWSATEDGARAAMDTTAVLDLSALASFECADAFPNAAPVMGDDAALDTLLQRTLLLGGSNGDQRTMAFDHATWGFRAVEDTQKKRGRFLPLDTTGFFTGGGLYAAAKKTKDSYGRFALRLVDAVLEGRDIRELKTRLILWGSDTEFVDLRNDRFDDGLRKALVRFKRDRQLFRRRVDGANGIDDDASVVTAIVDADTYRALDAAQPSVALADVASKAEPPNNDAGLLSEKGYERVLLYAAEIALRRIAPTHAINLASCIRTLAHNRYVYLGGSHQLNWYLATSAPAETFEYHGFTSKLKGEKGRDGSSHAAGAHATHATVRYDLPRGTYRGEAGAVMAADYSMHTTGQAIDFDLGRQDTATQSKENQVQWDTQAMVLFGAHRGPSHASGRLWLEPHKDASHPTWTTTWIHLDTSSIPDAQTDFVLTDADALGPRWDATVIANGTVTQGGAPRLGARVDLLRDGVVVATTYADPAGKYSLRVAASAASASYTVQAQFVEPYAFQPPPPAPAPGSPIVGPPQIVSTQITVAWPGEEVRGVDVELPDGQNLGAPDAVPDPTSLPA